MRSALSLSPSGVVLIVAVGALGTTVPAAPGYVGTYELAASAAARALGIAASPALGLALVLHAVTLVPIAVAGAVSLAVMGAGSLRDLASEATENQHNTA